MLLVPLLARWPLAGECTSLAKYTRLPWYEHGLPPQPATEKADCRREKQCARFYTES